MLRKINTKLVRSNDAVSAVIGVILMVAITVAIAATVYVYVNGMMSTPEIAPHIMGTKTLIDDGVAIELTGESITTNNVRFTVIDKGDNVTTINDPVKSTSYSNDTTYNWFNFTWVDANGDDKVGSGDTLKLTNDGGLATGTWYVKIIDIPSGKPSMSIDIEIN